MECKGFVVVTDAALRAVGGAEIITVMVSPEVYDDLRLVEEIFTLGPPFTSYPLDIEFKKSGIVRFMSGRVDD